LARDTRDRMIDATVQALQRYGLAGTSFTEVLSSSGAARGAIYHHFPGGKSELVAAAGARNGDDVRARLEALPAATPLALVEGFLALVRPVLEASARGGGCAVAALTIGAGARIGDSTDDEALRRIAATAFASWTSELAGRLTVAGLPKDEATDLAALLLALLEGAHVLCRASRAITPFDQAARAATDLARSRYSS
jgi:TetR/AcrR family transcriptional repressor of lmrAB and yxaGH operons